MIHVGRFRGGEGMQIVSGPVGKEKIQYVTPPDKILAGEMDRFFQWINDANPQDTILFLPK